MPPQREQRRQQQGRASPRARIAFRVGRAIIADRALGRHPPPSGQCIASRRFRFTGPSLPRLGLSCPEPPGRRARPRGWVRLPKRRIDDTQRELASRWDGDGDLGQRGKARSSSGHGRGLLRPQSCSHASRFSARTVAARRRSVACAGPGATAPASSAGLPPGADPGRAERARLPRPSGRPGRELPRRRHLGPPRRALAAARARWTRASRVDVHGGDQVPAEPELTIDPGRRANAPNAALHDAPADCDQLHSALALSIALAIDATLAERAHGEPPAARDDDDGSCRTRSRSRPICAVPLGLFGQAASNLVTHHRVAPAATLGSSSASCAPRFAPRRARRARGRSGARRLARAFHRGPHRGPARGRARSGRCPSYACSACAGDLLGVLSYRPEGASQASFVETEPLGSTRFGGELRTAGRDPPVARRWRPTSSSWPRSSTGALCLLAADGNRPQPTSRSSIRSAC